MKYRFEGIGATSATLTIAALAASPLAWFTQGLQGRIVFHLLKWLYMGLASKGLIVLNIGVSKVEVLVQKGQFDGSMDEAFKIINERQGKLTPEEIHSIDSKVIVALRKFGRFGVRERRDP